MASERRGSIAVWNGVSPERSEPPKAVARGVRSRGHSQRDELDQRCHARLCFGPKPVSPEAKRSRRRRCQSGVRNPFRRGGLHRTRPRSRICIRRAGRRTGKAPASKGEHGCPDRDRTLEGKPALNIAKQPTSNAEQAARHCHGGRDLIDYTKSRSGGMADAADLKSAAW